MPIGKILSLRPRGELILADILGELGKRTDGCFGEMEIAKREIKAFSELYPEREADIKNAFVQLRWILETGVPGPVYVEHVHELLARVVEKNSLTPGTKAEALMLLSEGSLVAPLDRQSAALYVELFEEIYPDTLDERPVTIHEPWEGASNELLADLRQKTKLDRRL